MRSFEFGGDLLMDMKARAKKLKTDIPALFLALKDGDTPIIAKLFAGITVAYALSPIDLVPDFIPLLGYLDDVILLPMLVALAIKFIPSEVLEKIADKQKIFCRYGANLYDGDIQRRNDDIYGSLRG